MTLSSPRRFVPITAGAVLALTCLLGAVVCGACSTSSPSNATDAATHRDTGHDGDAAAEHDAGPHADASKGTDAKNPHDAPGNGDGGGVLGCSGGCTNGLGCAPGCSVVATCKTGGNECSCDCADAALGDSGHACQPDIDAGCPGYYIPGTCFDAAIPASPSKAQCAAFCGDTNIAACGPTLPGGQPGILCATCLQQ